jgi:hypothetical protein
MISNIITTRTGEERLLGYDVTVEPANSEVIEPTGNLLGGRPSVQDFISTTQDLLEEGRSIPVNDLAPDSVVID